MKKPGSKKSGSQKSSRKRDKDSDDGSGRLRASGRQSARGRPPAGGDGEKNKLLAIKITMGVGLLAVILIAVNMGGGFQKAPPPRPVIDHNVDLSQADKWCEQAAVKAREGRSMMSSDRNGARASLQAALDLLDKATVKYTEILDKYPDEPKYEFLGDKVDRMNLEKVTYRKLIGELRQ